MSTPVATVADALIAFIMSLLRDPAAVEEFDAAPKAVLASNGLQDACADDVQAVKPVIVDHPAVMVEATAPPPPPPPPAAPRATPGRGHQGDPEHRPTVHDDRRRARRSSTSPSNQNIWTNGGDVTQIFDQEAVVASGDEAVAAGDDATVVDSEVDVDGRRRRGRQHDDDGSFNNTGGCTEARSSSTTAVDQAAASDAAAAEVCGRGRRRHGARRHAARAVPEAPVDGVGEPPTETLAADMTTADTYESDDAGRPCDEAYVEEPTEEQ